MNTDGFEKNIGYTFVDPHILEEALTHSSCCAEDEDGVGFNNERLEFIGDAFLDAVAGAMLYERMPHADEGELSKMRAQVVCERTLAEVGRRIGIGSFIDMSRGEELLGGRDKDSVTADAVEALIGAVYMDAGTEAMSSFVRKLFDSTVDDALNGMLFSDYKSKLQETIQMKRKSSAPKYTVVREEGPDHDKTFYVNVMLDGVLLGQGKGKSKKTAEQNAARKALEEGTEHVL